MVAFAAEHQDPAASTNNSVAAQDSTCTASTQGLSAATASATTTHTTHSKGGRVLQAVSKRLFRGRTMTWSWNTVFWKEKHAQDERRDTLADANVEGDILRAVRANRAMSGIGSHFRSSGGSALTYDLSEPVESIGSFWSHSWHANANHKVGTLFFVYNAPFAAVASVIGTMVCAFLVSQGIVPGTICYSNGCDTHEDCTDGGFCNAVFPYYRRCMHESLCCEEPSRTSIDGTCPYDCSVSSVREKPFMFWPLLAGFLSYLLVLVVWQPRTKVFLDKICIHQTDITKKRHGIDSLGGFLRRSEEMLLLWDSTYFSRLWCTFELAAFLFIHGSPDGVRVMPVVRGFFVLVGVFANFLLQMVLVLMRHFELVAADYVDLIGHLLFMIWFVHIARQYARHHYDMDRQLRMFACDNANCWCCTVNHINPDTKAKVPCDREVIYAVLEQWFPGGKKEFEAHVRKDLLGHVHRMFGGMLLVSDALQIGLPQLWRQVSYWGSDCTGWQNSGIRVLLIFTLWFSLSPFFAGIIVWISSHFHKKMRRCDWVVTLVFAAFLGAFQYGWIILSYTCLSIAWWAAVLLGVIQLILGKVLLTHAGRPQDHKTGVEEAELSTLPEEVADPTGPTASEVDKEATEISV